MKRNLFGAVLGHTLFWGWNLLFLLVVVAGFGPVVMVGLVLATMNGLVPWHITAFAVAIVALPVLGMVVGAWKLRRDPGRLLSLFYGVQAPLMLLCLVRLFAIQALTPATALFLVVVAIGCFGLLRTLLSGFAERSTGGQLAREVAQSAYLLSGIWWAVVVALYTVPLELQLLAALPEVILDFDLDAILHFPLILLYGSFFAATACMVLVFPAAMLGISVRAWQLVHRRTAERIGAARAAAVTLATVGGLLLAFTMTSGQPQAGAFRLLDQATTDEARREALAHSDAIRHGLVNARLAGVRHFDGDPDGDHVARIWQEVVGETLAAAPQALWRGAMAPFVYQPVREGSAWHPTRWHEPIDVSAAEAHYAAFFDAPMSRAERETLVRAMRQTWSWEDAQASLLEIGEQKVHLDRQDVTVERHGDLAVVSIHDVYRNRTWQDEEVWVSFSLPPSAVATGLWLGATDDRDAAFRYVVAPRGAAQEVYEQEVRRQVDPALLEQVGPRQYRLRAYPVLAREGEASDVWAMGSEGPELHLWLELVVPLQDDAFALPKVAEIRNLFWDEDTVRTLDGERVVVDGWVPERIEAPESVRTTHQARIGSVVVRAEPAGPIVPTRKGRVAVLVDGTRSMEAHRDAIDDALARLRSMSDGVVVLCTVEQRLMPCDGFSAADALFWGSVALETRLVEAAGLVEAADALVVLTDAGSYELAAEAERAGLPDVQLPPLWLVHLGGVPVAYPDWTGDRLQRTGGGAVTSIDELIVAWSDPAVVDGWRWSIEELPVDGIASGPFDKLAARWLVAEMDRDARQTGLLALDAMHGVAVEAEIVTPYSSMIVLVEDRQREALAAAEARDDRFDREVTGGEAEPVITAAPEPATWLLLALGGGALAGLRRRASRDAIG